MKHCMILALLLCLFFVSGPVLVVAQFDDDDIDETFSRRAGNSSECPEELKFDGSGDKLIIEADEIEAEEENCDGGEIRLEKNPERSAATRYFRENEDDVDSFLAGNATEDIRCGTFTLRGGEEFVFIKPEDDITVKWRDVFGVETDLEREDEEFKFDDDEKYVVVGSRCVYRESTLLDRVCFPAEALVRLADGSTRRMDELAVGDEVAVGGGLTSSVIGWSHRDLKARAAFVRATVSGGRTVAATEGHLMRKADGGVVAMRDVSVGTELKLAEAEQGEAAVVEKVERYVARGVFNPHTAAGEIVVDGFVATCYTEAVHAPAAHALLAPVRAAAAAVGKAWARVASVAAGVCSA